MPDRRDIDPAEVGELLTHIALLDVEQTEGEDVRLFSRLAGQEVERVFGAMRRKSLSDVLVPEIEARWRAIAQVGLEWRAPLRISGIVHHEGKHYLRSEVLVAPLTDGGDRISTLLMVSVFSPLKSG